VRVAAPSTPRVRRHLFASAIPSARATARTPRGVVAPRPRLRYTRLARAPEDLLTAV